MLLEARKLGMDGKDCLNYLLLQEGGGGTVKGKGSQAPVKSSKDRFYSVLLQ